MIRVGIISTNVVPLSPTTKKGSEIFLYTFLTALATHEDAQKNFSFTVFASGNSQIPFPLVSISQRASWEDSRLSPNDHKLLELALLSQAFSQEKNFDLFHIHMSNGEYALPFAPLVHIPILITLHGAIPNEAGKEYYDLFTNQPHVSFVAISEAQRKQLPTLRYAQTIIHGINEQAIPFDPVGGESIMWGGRGNPEKGPQIALEVIARTKKPASLFALLNEQDKEWFETHITHKIEQLNPSVHNIILSRNNSPEEILHSYQNAKLFLLPLGWEEPFGLMLVESMAAGTPVIAFARGAAPEIIIDGKTGFLVNETINDPRGNWIIKTPGVEGLIEAVERIYRMNKEDYERMRKDARTHVEEHFRHSRMVNDYLTVYRQLLHT